MAEVTQADREAADFAEAIEAAENACRFNMRLIRLVDGVSTYSLLYADGLHLEFNDQDELYEHIRQRKLRMKGEALASVAARHRTEAVKPLVEALRAVRADIMNENGLNSASICCTVWHSEIETTVDYIDAVLEDVQS